MSISIWIIKILKQTTLCFCFTYIHAPTIHSIFKCSQVVAAIMGQHHRPVGAGAGRSRMNFLGTLGVIVLAILFINFSVLQKAQTDEKFEGGGGGGVGPEFSLTELSATKDRILNTSFNFGNLLSGQL